MSTGDRREFLQQTTAGLALAMSLAPAARALGTVYRPPRPINIGLVGAGRQGREILSELAKFQDVEVSAVCEVDALRLSRGLRRTRKAQGYADLDAMLEKQPGLEAVCVATPTHLHKDISLRLLEARKHVYCEAPMASSVADLKALAKAAAQAPTVFQVGHHARSNPVYQLARSFYRAGSIERLVAARTQWRRKTSWRIPTDDPERDRDLNWRLHESTSSGLPGEEGSHLFDTVRWFTDLVPRTVRGAGATLLYQDGREVPDTVLCLFGFGDGVTMTFDATLANSFESTFETLIGTMGTIKLAGRYGWLFKEADAPVQGWEVYANRQQFHDEQGITLIADATKLASQGKLQEGLGLPHPPLYYALESFLGSVAERKDVACTALDGLYAAAVAVKAHEAVRDGGEVVLDQDLFKL